MTPRRFLIAGLLLLIPLQAMSARTRLSPTTDESAKLSSGYAYLLTGEFRMDLEHPPLIKTLAALPLLFVKDTPPENLPEWDQSSFPGAAELVEPEPEELDRLFFWASVPMALLAAALGLLVCIWSTRLYGAAAGMLSLLLVVFDPGILAFGGLVNNDLGAAFFITLFLFCLWRFLSRPNPWTLLAAGLTLGLAQVSKLSALFLFPTAALILWIHWRVRRQKAADTVKAGGDLLGGKREYFTTGLAIFVLSCLVIWASYGFEIGLLKNLEGAPRVAENEWFQILPAWFQRLLWNTPVPAESYFHGIRFLLQHFERGHWAFLAGEFSQFGWWYYFPVAFLLKTPLPTLLLVSLGLALTALRFRWSNEVLCLVVPLAIYWASTLNSSIQIGYRHLLPVLPLSYILAGQVMEKARPALSLRTLAPIVCLVWLAAESLWIWPDYLAYFNPAAGGPSRGHEWLLDSNLDWGQDLKRLKEYMNQKGLERVKLSYFGSTSPHLYGIEYKCLPSPGCPDHGPVILEPGVYVISINFLQGLILEDPDTYAPFRRMSPVDRIGYSLFVYEIEDSATSVGRKR